MSDTETIMGDAGKAMLIPRGQYSDTETYEYLDFVYSGDASYVAKKLTTGNPPAEDNEYWQLLARGGTLTENSDVSNTTVTFEEAEQRINIFSKDSLSVIAGKIKKWFADLKTVAFSGKYSDLEGRLTVTNNDLANVPGTAWDAVRGAAIRKDVDKINSDLQRNAYNLTTYCTFSYLGDNKWMSSPIPLINADKYNIYLSGNVKNATEENAHAISQTLFTVHKCTDCFFITTDKPDSRYIIGTVALGIVWEFNYNVAKL